MPRKSRAKPQWKLPRAEPPIDVQIQDLQRRKANILDKLRKEGWMSRLHGYRIEVRPPGGWSREEMDHNNIDNAIVGDDDDLLLVLVSDDDHGRYLLTEEQVLDLATELQSRLSDHRLRQVATDLFKSAGLSLTTSEIMESIHLGGKDARQLALSLLQEHGRFYGADDEEARDFATAVLKAIEPKWSIFALSVERKPSPMELAAERRKDRRRARQNGADAVQGQNGFAVEISRDGAGENGDAGQEHEAATATA